MEWTDEVIERLRTLWAEGHSTAEIGRRLGVSKNAIVGKAHRLDLTARPSPIRRDPTAQDAARQAPTRRLEGSTLPPLASTDAPIPVVAAIIEPPSAPPPAPIVVPVAVPPLSATPLSTASLSAGPMVTDAPVAAPPRSVPVPVARSQPAPARPYGRVITCCWPIGEPGTRSLRTSRCATGARTPPDTHACKRGRAGVSVRGPPAMVPPGGGSGRRSWLAMVHEVRA